MTASRKSKASGHRSIAGEREAHVGGGVDGVAGETPGTAEQLRPNGVPGLRTLSSFSDGVSRAVALLRVIF